MASPSMAVGGVSLPALSKAVVILTCAHFRRRYCRDLNKEVGSVAQETLEILERYNWPGNIRELQSLLKRALLQTTGPLPCGQMVGLATADAALS
jgi:DNA-binding NtrC family response regulator